MNLSMDGRENTKVEVNGNLRGKGLNMHMGKKNVAPQKRFNAARQGHGSKQQQ